MLAPCAVRPVLPFFQDWCDTQHVSLAAWDRLEQLADERRSLEQRLAVLEARLAGETCVPAPQPEPPPEPEITEDGIDRKAWKDGDVSLLAGCWELDGIDYKTRDIDTGRITTFRLWEICFDADGRGQQMMRSTDGVECQDSATASFLDENRLQINDGTGPACDNGARVFRRETTCTLAQDGRAQCRTRQPDRPGQTESSVRLRRKEP